LATANPTISEILKKNPFLLLR